MPLAFRDPNEVSDYTPYLTWKPSQGHFEDRDGRVEIDAPLCIDLPKLELGWRRFKDGRFEFVPDADRTTYTAKPDNDKEWKRGFRVILLSSRAFGKSNPMREWSDDGSTNQKAIETLWREYEKQCPNCDKAAIVKFTGGVPVSYGASTYKMASFVIEELIDRPSKLDKNDNSGDVDTPSATVSPENTEEDEFLSSQ